MSGASSDDDFPAHLLPGELIAERYRIVRSLGAGGMGFVVEAQHTTLGQSVAVKVLRKEYAKDPDLLARFLREGQIAARLPSDHIARVHDVGQTAQGEPLLVMELLHGHDLEAELAARGRMPIAEAVDLVLRACKGVAAAHAEGLIHRDLKPANLFLQTGAGGRTVKILDFGITKVRAKDAALTQTTASYGTPQYMSPEQIKSAKHVDERTDQHALGVIVYELLTGEPPFRAESIPALMVVIATEDAPPLRPIRPEVSAGLEAAVLRALAKRRSARFADVGEFATAIAPFGSEAATPLAREVVELLAAAKAPNGAADTLRHVGRTGDPNIETLATATRTQRPTRPIASWKVAAGVGVGALVAVVSMRLLSLFDDGEPASATRPGDGPAPEATEQIAEKPAPSAISAAIPHVEIATGAEATPPGPSSSAVATSPSAPPVRPPSIGWSKPSAPAVPAAPSASAPPRPPADPGEVFGN